MAGNVRASQKVATASRLVMKGISIYKVSQWLGHIRYVSKRRGHQRPGIVAGDESAGA